MNQLFPRIWVLGAGQLGAMLKTAGRPLNLDICPIEIDVTDVPQLDACDLVTAEREQWPTTAVTQALSQHPNFINRHVFGRLADRKTQKALIDELALATAPWQAVEMGDTAEKLHQQLGANVLLKRRTGGYDGRGQHWLRQGKSEDCIPEDWLGHAIAEQAIAFDEEVSLIGARSADGQCVFYPLTLNLHVDGILLGSVSPLPRLAPLQAKAEAMLSALLNKLEYVGVMAMECFRLGDQLLINELAPRVHNSGHWTQAGSNIDQFELHLRMITQRPVAPLTVKAQSLMVNLVGTEFNPKWYHVAAAEVTWYGKSVRDGRKVGHINLCHADLDLLEQSLSELETLLPAHYQPVIQWLKFSLSNRG